jgi:hypothetical protein
MKKAYYNVTASIPPKSITKKSNSSIESLILHSYYVQACNIDCAMKPKPHLCSITPHNVIDGIVRSIARSKVFGFACNLTKMRDNTYAFKVQPLVILFS